MGGSGNDVLIGGAGGLRDGDNSAGDILVGGSGLDVASYETASAGVSASLSDASTNSGDAAGDVYSSIEGLVGSDFGDTLEGDALGNEITGGQGDDTLRGGAGDDLYVFRRGDGKDTIIDELVVEQNVVVAENANNPSGPARVSDLQPPYTSNVQLVDRAGASYNFEHTVTNTETGEIVYRRGFAGDEVAAGAGYEFGYDGHLAEPEFLEAEGWVDSQGTDPRFVVSGSQVAFETSYAGAGTDTILFEESDSGEAISLSDLSFAFSGDDLVITVNNGGGSVTLQNFRDGADVRETQAIETLQFSDGTSFGLTQLQFDASGNFVAAPTSNTSQDVVDEFFVTDSTAVQRGGFGDDTFVGGDASNRFFGDAGDDFFVGSLGVDYITGGEGVDTVSYSGSGVGVHLHLQSNWQTTGGGSQASGDYVNTVENAIGSRHDDFLIGSDTDNVLRGLGGDDVLIAGRNDNGSVNFGRGDDVLIGGEGNDTAKGGVGYDNLDGGSGNDVLEGGGDGDVLVGGDGNDILRGDSWAVSGSSGVEENGINAGGRTRVVNYSFEDMGEAGDDTTFAQGVRSDDLTGWTSTEDRPFELLNSASGLTSFRGTYALNLDDGVNRTVSQAYDTFAQGDRIRISFHVANLAAAGADDGVEVLWNGDVVGTYTNNSTQLISKYIHVDAKGGTDTLTFRALGNEDGLGAAIDHVTVYAQESADQLIGGAGSDRLLGDAGDDLLLGGDGDDNSSIQITAGAAADNVQTFAAGLYGGAGDDILDGGAGADTLDGGGGNDSYLFRRGSGDDTVIIGGGQDDLVFEEISSDQLWLRQVGNDLEITAIGLDASVLVQDWFVSETGEPNQARRIVTPDQALARSDIAALVAAMADVSASVPAQWPSTPSQEFSDVFASAWQDLAEYEDRAVIVGTSANDTSGATLVSDPVLIGGARYFGLEGHDAIDARRYNADGSEQVLADVIDGGVGSNNVWAGAGDDLIYFDADTRGDTIRGGDGFDTLQATADNSRFNASSISGVEAIDGAGFGNVKIYANGGSNPEYTLDLGSVTLTDIVSIHGNNKSHVLETIIGSEGNDVIYANKGDDAVFGGGGDDRIHGGLGNDTIDGGEGSDTYNTSAFYYAGTIDISDPSAGSHVAFHTDGSVYSTDTLINIENVRGSDRNDVITGSSAANRLDGYRGSDTINGGAGDDLLTGGHGSDTLDGGEGIDTANYKGSTSGVTVNLASNTQSGSIATGGHAQGDRLDNIENLVGSEHADTLTGDDGDNVLTGGGGNDTLHGGAGTDTAAYSGSRTDYVYDFATQTVTNTFTGEVDSITSIEYLQFDDATIALGIDPNNGPQLGQPGLDDLTWEDSAQGTYQIPATAFYDLDLGDGMDFEATLADGGALPDWLSFDPVTQTFSGTPPVEAIGSQLEVTVTAIDVPEASQSEALSVSDTFTLTIAEARGATLTASGTTPLAGTFRAETMLGTSEDNVFLGSGGADQIEGLESTPAGDLIDYSASGAGVLVDLANGTGFGGDAEGDQLVSIESVIGSAFADTLFGTDGANELVGLEGDDTIEGGAGDDFLDGGAGENNLSGGLGNDTFALFALADGRIADVVDGGSGIDHIILSESAYGAVVDLSETNADLRSIEHAIGSDFDDQITGNVFGNSIEGGLGNDIISGGRGGDTLHGNHGDDVVDGGQGNDSIYGDMGDDRLIGGQGADKLYGGEGNDTVDYSASAEAVEANLAINEGMGGDAQGDIFAFSNSEQNSSIENIDGSQFGDILTGDTDANVLKGLGGDDVLEGGAGNDTLDGGAGDDTIVYSGNRSDYTIDFASGTILHNATQELDTFISVENIQFADETISAGSQAPTVVNGLSNQTTNDNDVFSYTIPFDAFDDQDGDASDPYAGLAITARLSSGAALPSWLIFDEASKTFTYSGTGAPFDQSFEIEVTASDGQTPVSTTFSLSVTKGAGETVTGTAGNDTLGGTFRSEAINSLAGDDTIVGSDDGDTIDGGDGTDRVSYEASVDGVIVDLANGVGSAGDALGDTLVSIENVTGSALADSISGGAGTNVLNGGDGNDTLSGGLDADALYGDEGNDTLFGGEGDDGLIGGAGVDQFDGGAGTDWVFYFFSSEGVLATQGATVDLQNQSNNAGAAAGETYVSIENIYGSEQTDELYGDANANEIQGASGNDILDGRAGDDILDGGHGNDTIHGGDGNDTLIGGSGSNSLYGGAGDDALTGGNGYDYLFGGEGADVLDGGASVDTVIYIHSTEGVNINLETGAASGGDAEGDTIVAGTIERADGSNHSDVITGSSGNNYLKGKGGDDIIYGGAGNDNLAGGNQNDTLIGGAGADHFSGGYHNDTVDYSSAAAGGSFTTAQAIGAVSVNGTAIATAETRSLNGVFVHLGSTGPADGVRGRNSDAEGDTFDMVYTVENIVGSAFADELYGWDTDGVSGVGTIIDGGAGDDVVYGGTGDDTLIGGSGDDFMFGGDGQDHIDGGEGNDRLFGEGASDSLYGGAGNDILDAGDSGDMLDGGTGDDVLIGGAGDDQYFFTKTSGSDVIYNYDSNNAMGTDFQDVVQYGDGITRDHVWFTKVAGTKDLRVKVLGHDSDVTIKDWFANTQANDFNHAGPAFVLRMFIANTDIATTQDSLETLLTIMADIPEPASFGALSQAQQDAISAAWLPNSVPTISADAGNVTSIEEDGTTVLTFALDDNGESPLSALSVGYSTTGALEVVSTSHVDGVFEATVRGASNASGDGSLILTVFDGVLRSDPLEVQVGVNAVADGVTLSAGNTASGNSGTAIALPQITASLIDADGSEYIDFLRVEAVPVGAMLSDGSGNSFTATSGNRNVDVKNWDFASLSITPQSGSAADFNLIVRSRSRETSNGVASADTTRSISVSVNGAPTAIGVSTVAFDENSIGPVEVATLSAADPDGTSGLSFEIVGGADAAKFEISGNSVFLADGEMLNFEDGNAILDIRVTDQGGLSFTRSGIAIRPDNVDEGPSGLTINGPNSNDPEIAEKLTGATGYTLSATDPEGDAISYVFANNNSDTFGKFQIVNGALHVIDALDFEGGMDDTTLTFKAISSGGASNTITRTFTVTNVEEAIVFTTDHAELFVDEDMDAGYVIDNFVAQDPDNPNETLEYSIVNSNVPFAMNGNNLVLAGAGVDFEAQSQYTLTIRAEHSGAGNNEFTDTNVVVRVRDVNEKPYNLRDANGGANQILENTSGAVGVTIRAADPENDNLTYEIIGGNERGWFSINASSGVISASSAVNYEDVAATGGEVVLSVRAKDPDGAKVERGDISITILDDNEALTNTTSNQTIDENRDVNAYLATLSSTDPDIGDSVTYSFVAGGTTQGKFKIVGDELRLASGTLDHEVQASYNISVRATDGGGNTSDKTFTLTIGDVNEKSSAPTDFDTTVNENDLNFALQIGGSQDPEGEAVTYNFVNTGGNPHGIFEITPEGLLTINPDVGIDFEIHGGSVDVTIISIADGVDGHATTSTITINNLNDNNPNTPVASGGTRTFNEHSGAGALVATLSASDPDGNLNPLSFELASNPHGMFVLSGNQLRVRSDRDFNFEDYASSGSSTTLNVQVRATDGTRDSSTRTVAVQINNVDEAPTASFVGTPSIIYENTYNPGSAAVIGRLEGSDVEGDTLRYSIENDGGNFGGALTIDAVSGEIKIANGFDYEAFPGAGNSLVEDDPVNFSVTFKVRQLHNSSNFVLKTLDIEIRDQAEEQLITPENGNIFSSSGYAPGYSFESVTSGDYDDEIGEWYGIQEDRILFGTAPVAERTTETNAGVTQDWVATGYQWTGGSFSSDFIKRLPPIVFDLNGDGLIASDVTTEFDIDGDGAVDSTGWISGEDAFLALDRDGDGAITSGAEISFVQDLPGARTDLEGLTAFDSNGDGFFTADDDRFAEFLVWRDANEDGISQAGELQSLLEAGIVGIDLTGVVQLPSDEGGVVVVATSTYQTADGSNGLVGDVGLRWNSIPGANDAIDSGLLESPIAFDADGNGSIDTEMEVARTAEEAAAFDSNGDGVIDASDDRYFDLRLWSDANDNNRAEPNELVGLNETDTPAIDLSVTNSAPVANDDADEAQEPASLEFGRQRFADKRKRYRLRSIGGSLFIGPKNEDRAIDQRAGLMSGPMYLDFKKRSFGMLNAVVLDMDQDGLETRRYKKTKTAFDMDGNGTFDDVGWTKSNDGFLVMDRNGNGRIDDATEMAFLDADGALRNGQAGLLALDTNGDGLVSADDELFAELSVWVDRDRDGTTDAGEMQSLSDLGIESIGLGFTPVEETKKLGRNVTLATTVFTREDGTTGTVGDIAFGFVPGNQPVSRPVTARDNRRIFPADILGAFGDTPFGDKTFDELLDLWEGRRDEIGYDPSLVRLSPSAESTEDQRSTAEVGGSTRERLAEEEVEAVHVDPADNSDAPLAARLALLRQEMAAFGGDTGIDNFGDRRDRVYMPLDYFA